MTTATVTYNGNLRTTAIHLQSNNEIITDAPTDNHGKGEAFSPTDMLATSLASCMLTTMAIKAKQLGEHMDDSVAEVTKVMASDPRRVAEVQVKVTAKTGKLGMLDQRILENVARGCPVAKSLHPDVKQEISFDFV